MWDHRKENSLSPVPMPSECFSLSTLARERSCGLLFSSHIPVCSLSFALFLVHTDKSLNISLSALFPLSDHDQFPHAGTSSLELTGWALMWEDFDRPRTEITDLRFQQNIFSNHFNISWLSCVLPLGISSHQGLESRVEDLRWTPDVHVLISTVHWECRLHFSDHLWFLWSM